MIAVYSETRFVLFVATCSTLYPGLFEALCSGRRSIEIRYSILATVQTWHVFASVSRLIVVDLEVEEARRKEAGTRVGKVQMTFCESAEVRRQTSGLTEENRVAGVRVQLKESMVEQCSLVAAILEVHLGEEGDQIQNAEEGKD